MRWVAAGGVALVLVLPSCAEPAGNGDAGPGSLATSPSTAPPRPAGASALLPEARTEVAGVAWQGRMVVLGGLTSEGNASSRVHFYEPVDDTWSSGPALPMPLHHTTAVVGPAGRLWVVGGYSGGRDGWQPRAEVWSLGPSEGNWREEPPLNAARGALAAASSEGAIVAVGGTTAADGAARSVSRIVEFLTPGAPRWERGPDLFEQREHLAAATVGDRVLAIGGRVGGLDTNLRSVESWKPGEGTWRRESPLQKERGGFAAATVDGVPCVAGGEQPNQTIPQVECLQGDEWRIVAQLAEPRHGLAVAALAGMLHVVAGGPKPGLFVSDAHEVLDVDA